MHFGSGREISIGDLVGLIAQLMDRTVTIREDAKRIRPKGSEVQRLWADNSLIHSLTGYEPEVTLKEGLKEVISWLSEPSNRLGDRASNYAV